MLVRGLGEHDFALWVAELAERGGGYVEGDRAGGAEHGGGHVDVFNVNEDAGAEPDLVEGVVVFTHCLPRAEWLDMVLDQRWHGFVGIFEGSHTISSSAPLE